MTQADDEEVEDVDACPRCHGLGYISRNRRVEKLGQVTDVAVLCCGSAVIVCGFFIAWAVVAMFMGWRAAS